MNILRRMFGQPESPEAASKPPASGVMPAPASLSPATAATVGAASVMSDEAAATPNTATAVPETPEAQPPTEPEPSPVNPPDAAPAPEKPRMLDLSDTHPLTADGIGDQADGVTRPLPPEVALEVVNNRHAIFGQETDLGRVRTNNEDAVFSFFSSSRTTEAVPDFGLFVVADGMGGHSDGERASAIAARTVAAHILRDSYLPLCERDDKDTPIAEVVTKAIQRANEAVVQNLTDGGTTVSVAVLIGDMATLGHVGDSRIYLISRGKIERITRDHSWVQRLIELDQLTPDEANEHPQKNLLYRALGQSDSLEADTLMRRMPPSSRLLLCSDGLWNQVPDADILAAVMQAATPQDACQRLIAMANSAGGPDNISVIVVQLPG